MSPHKEDALPPALPPSESLSEKSEKTTRLKTPKKPTQRRSPTKAHRQHDLSTPLRERAPQTVSLKTARGRTTAQQRWLIRQLNDPYVHAAHQQGWRSRAAFKLIELDDRFHFIRNGIKAVDLGAAPGSWTQVLLQRGAKRVVGIDLLPVKPLLGADILEGDFTDPDMPEHLKALLGRKADLVLSDMAPNTTGHASTDHLRIIALAEEAFFFARDILAEGGGFIAKVFQGGAEKTLLTALKQNFTHVRHAKPPASRKNSSEIYVIATGFRSPQEG
ncbi:MAG: RlmE family RNA methyltransferase [Acetobacter sp.]|nr:RlmE family RNA methyltransferase [Acetobacter sp.]